jgi:hypothetical protein
MTDSPSASRHPVVLRARKRPRAADVEEGPDADAQDGDDDDQREDQQGRAPPHVREGALRAVPHEARDEQRREASHRPLSH